MFPPVSRARYNDPSSYYMTTLVKARPKPVEISSYAFLRERVRETLLEGQQKIEQQKVLTYWQTGNYIHEHSLFHKDRAEYGRDVIEKLALDLNISDKLLYQCLQGYRVFKNFYARRNSYPNLTWAHYRAAMRIPDEKKRLALLEEAAEGEWTSRELEIEVRNHNWADRISQSEDQKPPQLPPVTLGLFHTYQIIRPKTVHPGERGLVLDCGFSFKKEISQFPGARFSEGTIVTSVKTARGYSLEAVKGASPKNPNDLLYTYKAYVVDVIDGDTLKVDFRLGFGDRKGETIRLNHIDCPEIDTPEGRAAKRFVESQLAGCPFITVKSVKTRKEKWGRYLGDIFLQKKATDPPIYLNQLLLDKDHAVRVRV